MTRSPIPQALLFFPLLGLLTALTPAQDSRAEEPRPAALILRDFASVAMPTVSDGGSSEAVARFKRAIADGCRRKAELAWELYLGHPDHPSVPRLLSMRWSGMNNALGQSREVLREIGALLKTERRPAIRAQAAAGAARAGLLLDAVPVETKLSLMEAMIKLLPDDDRCAVFLADIARHHIGDPKHMRGLCERVLRHWPENQWGAVPAKGLLKRLEGVGKPCSIAFDDVLGSGHVDTADWKGQVVVFQVWSGDSETIRKEFAALAALKEKHPELKVAGVRVWQSRSDAKTLMARLRKAGIGWPHALPNTRTPWAWKWSTNEVPFYRVVDRRGRLATVSHRLAPLVPTIERLLAAPASRRSRL